MEISIAMATYNGSSFLVEQLESFANQTRLPNELVVCDDNSSDNTLALLRDFAETTKFTVRIIPNDRNIGYTKNFEKAISLCSGDLILLSDQDDVWLSNKIQNIENTFLAEPGIMVSVNDQEIVDAHLNSLGWAMQGFLRAGGFGDQNFVSGCCTAIRASFLEFLLPFPDNIAAHDEWIHQAASALQVKLVLPDVLQYWRRHCTNTTHLKIPLFRRFRRVKEVFTYLPGGRASIGWRSQIDDHNRLYERIQERRPFLEKNGLSMVANSCLCAKTRSVNALERRIKVVRAARPRRILEVFELYRSGDYECFSGWKSAVKDIIR